MFFGLIAAVLLFSYSVLYSIYNGIVAPGIWWPYAGAQLHMPKGTSAGWMADG